MSKIHVLLVGINEYHPDSFVSSLKGCLNDVNSIAHFLTKNYSAPSIETLVNHEATRANILETFQSHLIDKAQEGDTVLFYYSGHGSTSKTSEHFVKTDSKEQDETIICYDSRVEGNYDLSDKEIGVLLSRISENVQITVIADSCHSGSLTRGINQWGLGKRKFTPARKSEVPRPVASYLLPEDDFYKKMLVEKGNLEVPQSKHIQLSACERSQEAYETEMPSGLYTTTLLELLSEGKLKSYYEIHSRLKHKLGYTRDNQTPGIFPSPTFNQNTIFLSHDININTRRYPIIFKKGTWRFEMGAINGMPSDELKIKDLGISIFEKNDSKDFFTKAKIKSVLLKEAVLDFEHLNEKQNFWGEIESFPSIFFVNLKGDKLLVDEFMEIYAKKPSPFINLESNNSNSDYQVELENNEIRIISNGTVIHGVEGINEKGVRYITQILEQIEAYDRTLGLQNESTQFSNQDIEVVFVNKSDENNEINFSEKVLQLTYPDFDKDVLPDGKKFGHPFEIRVRNNTSRTLYISSFHLGKEFNVSPFNHEQKFPPNSDWVTLKSSRLIIKNETDWEVTDHFKVIISSEEFDQEKFKHAKIAFGKIAKDPDLRGMNLKRELDDDYDEEDWMTKTLSVRTVRRRSSITNESVNFVEEKISFSGHGSFKADISFSSINPMTRNAHPAKKLLEVFNDKDASILNLKNTSAKGFADTSIVQLSNVQNEKALKENPLEFNLNVELNEDESIIPVTFDGNFVIPLGSFERQNDGSSKFKIDSIPNSKADGSQLKRGALRSVWFCFLKVIGKKDKVFRLRSASRNNAGRVVRNDSAIRSDTDKAKKILLLIHGIIGDTKDMAKNFMFLKDKNQYDSILTFDYENLNEPIENIAKILSKKLEDIGLGANDGKTFDIIAHSMGGLVSRYMIEHIWKRKQIVNNLIMCGTPNGGSVFGSVPDSLSICQPILGLALNLSKTWLTATVIYIEQLNQLEKVGKVLTGTLMQMERNSPFIKKLWKNNSTTKTQYFVIAGDITDYTSRKNFFLSRFKENLLLGIGNLANSRESNDIAVKVMQILEIPSNLNAQEHIVTCHHLNYFEEEEPMNKIKEILEV